MPQIILHHGGAYNIYCSISDGIRFESALTLNQLQYWINEMYGKAGTEKLQKRLERAHKNGHSELSEASLDDFLCCNRAGPNESFLTTEQIIKQFLTL